MIDVGSAHDLLVTLHSNVEDAKVAAILGSARVQIESHMVKELPALEQWEIDLNTKQQRVQAYRTRTGCSSTLAHAVVNIAWRDAQRKATQINND